MLRAGPGEARPVWSHPGTAQEPRRRPQDRPREAQDSPTRPPEVVRGAQTHQGTISKRVLSDSGAPGTSKNLTKCCTVYVFRGFRYLAREPSTEAQKAPKGAPREAQMSPRRAPGGLRSGPRAANRGAHDHPGAPQERTQGAPSRPDASREPFGSPFWPHLGAPGASFSSLPGVLFEPRARSARQTKALFEITGQKVFRDRCGPDVQRPLST